MRGRVVGTARNCVSGLLRRFLLLAVGVWALLAPPAALARQLGAPLMRAIAVSENTRLENATVVIVEYLDVYNDDLRKELVVQNIEAEFYTVNRYFNIAEYRFDGRYLPLTVPPGEVRRIVVREYRTAFRSNRAWYDRWIRFRVYTDRGLTISNSFMAPLPDLTSFGPGSVFER